MGNALDPFGIQDAFEDSSNFKKFNATLGPVENILSDTVEERFKDPTPAGPAPTNPGIGGDTNLLDPEWAAANPDEAQAAITRAQWDESRRTFLPIENRLIDRVTSSIEPEATRAGATARKSFETGRQSQARNLSRRGVSLSASQQKGLARRQAIAETKGVATAENLTRRSLDDRNRNLQGSLAGLGKGIATSASSAFGSAANAQAQREATGRALNQQKQQSQLGGAASGAAIGFQYGGVYGGLIGGALGYAAG